MVSTIERLEELGEHCRRLHGNVPSASSAAEVDDPPYYPRYQGDNDYDSERPIWRKVVLDTLGRRLNGPLGTRLRELRHSLFSVPSSTAGEKFFVLGVLRYEVSLIRPHSLHVWSVTSLVLVSQCKTDLYWSVCDHLFKIINDFNLFKIINDLCGILNHLFKIINDLCEILNHLFKIIYLK